MFPMTNKLLTNEELTFSKEDIPNWEIKDSMLQRKWKFKDFVEAFGFITKVALVSEKIGHHPNLSNVYGVVTIELSTHDLGGISMLDITLAKAINKIDT